MTSAALIGAGSAAAADAAAAGAVDAGAGAADAARDTDEADAGAAGGDAGVAAARANDAASAHAPDKSVAVVAIGERAERGTGESYRKSRGTSPANYFIHETVKVSRIHGMLAHRAETAPTN
jgi:hypothetical protein